MTDDIVAVNSMLYVKSVVTMSGGEESISATGFARESESKKGMDESQITGSASSYARKYAFCGLFAIDGEKDADSRDNNDDVGTITEDQVTELHAIISDNDIDNKAFLKYMNAPSIEAILSKDYAKAKAALDKKIKGAK